VLAYDRLCTLSSPNSTSSQAARRDQNRIAQREFRLRKQQRIRELEARVELLSGNQDESFNYMRAIVKDLIQENGSLRSLVKHLAQAVGEGLPGFLPRMGWQLSEFNDFLNKSDTDTAIDSFARLKRQAVTHTVATGGGGGQKRPLAAEEDSQDPNKRARLSSGRNGNAAAAGSANGSQATPGSPDLDTLTRAAAASAVGGASGNSNSADMFAAGQEAMNFSAFFDMPYTNQPNAPIQSLAQPPVSGFPLSSGSAASQREMFAGGLPAMDLRPRSLVTGLPPLESTTGLGLTTAMSPPQAAPPSRESMSTPAPLYPDASTPEENPRIQEAFKMIHYHLQVRLSGLWSFRGTERTSCRTTAGEMGWRLKRGSTVLTKSLQEPSIPPSSVSPTVFDPANDPAW